MAEARQRVKCAINLSNIVAILKDLKEDQNKVELLRSSIFKHFLDLENDRESSGPLAHELCNVFDGTQFVLNPSTTLQICSHEVASVLGIANTGIVIDLSELETCSSVPSYLSTLQMPGDASNLKKNIVEMEIRTEEDEVFFVKRFTLFIIDQLFCPKTNYQKVNRKLFGLVDDLEKVTSLNWPEIVHGHIRKGLLESKAALAEDPHKQRVFNACSPVLDVILFERIPSIRPPIHRHYSQLLEKYCTKRRNYDLKIKTAEQVLLCDSCDQPSPLSQIAPVQLLPPPPENEVPVENEVREDPFESCFEGKQKFIVQHKLPLNAT